MITYAMAEALEMGSWVYVNQHAFGTLTKCEAQEDSHVLHLKGARGGTVSVGSDREVRVVDFRRMNITDLTCLLTAVHYIGDVQLREAKREAEIRDLKETAQRVLGGCDAVVPRNSSGGGGYVVYQDLHLFALRDNEWGVRMGPSGQMWKGKSPEEAISSFRVSLRRIADSAASRADFWEDIFRKAREAAEKS
jgi:hypothetical protein